jgi:hypothetical protein
MKEVKKIFITRYALSAGIQVRECEITGDVARPLCDGWQFFHVEGRDWHRTLDGAMARANEMRKTKIVSLNKQIKRLDALVFNVKDTTP